MSAKFTLPDIKQAQALTADYPRTVAFTAPVDSIAGC